MLGYSRDNFYRCRRSMTKAASSTYRRSSRKKPILANRTVPEIEAQIVAFSLEQPAYRPDPRRQ